jgi:tetratricopeptide (TPR) repeat protein
MGINSTISMQSSGVGQAAPRMLSMDMKKFSSKLKAAKTYIDQGNYEEALVHLHAAKKIKKTGKLFEYFGDAYTANREYAKAIESYKSAFSLYKKVPQKERALSRVRSMLRFFKVKGF